MENVKISQRERFSQADAHLGPQRYFSLGTTKRLNAFVLKKKPQWLYTKWLHTKCLKVSLNRQTNKQYCIEPTNELAKSVVQHRVLNKYTVE